MPQRDSLRLWAAVLLLAGGIINLFPPVYQQLRALTGSFPWVTAVIGGLSIIVALVLFAGEGEPGGPPS